jgi:hypothetical protein
VGDRPLLTVRDRQMPTLRARGGHGRRGRPWLRGGRQRSQAEPEGEARPRRPLGSLARAVGPAAAGGVRGSKPPPSCSSGRGPGHEGTATCGSFRPVVTGRARRGPAVPDATRTQHGPAPLRKRLAPVPSVADVFGAPVLRYQGPDRPAGPRQGQSSPYAPRAWEASSAVQICQPAVQGHRAPRHVRQEVQKEVQVNSAK